MGIFRFRLRFRYRLRFRLHQLHNHGVLGFLLDAVDEAVDFDALWRHLAVVEQIDGIAVQAVLALRVADAVLGVGLQRTGTVDGVAVLFQPDTNLFHPFQAGFGDVAVGVGTHVEQQVAALGDDVAKHMYQLVSRLVVVVVHIRPAVAHRHTGLPGVGQESVGHLLFGGAVVLVLAAHAAVDDKQVGVVLAGHLGDARHIDVLYLPAATEPGARLVVDAPFGTYPAAVEPQDVNVAVVVRQLAYLVVGEIAIAAPAVGLVCDGVVDVAVGRGPFRSPIVGTVPVGLREIVAYPHIVLAEGVGEGLGDVAVLALEEGAAAVDGAVGGLLGAVHTEAVVVFGGENHIFHTSLCCGLGPPFGIEPLGVEGGVEGRVLALVFVVGRILAVNPGLAAEPPRLDGGPLAVYAPVCHKSELEVLPVLKAFQDDGVGLVALLVAVVADDGIEFLGIGCRQVCAEQSNKSCKDECFFHFVFSGNIIKYQ